MPELQSESHDLDWNDLSLILAICRAESLSGAARILGQTHSTVFRRINAVEDKTGVRFFERFRNGYQMTDAGRSAMAYGERVEAEFHALGREVLGQDTALRGRIRVTSPEAFAEEYAPAMIGQFCEEHRDIQIDLVPSHGAVDMNKREAEVAIRATKSPPESSFGRKVCDFRFAMYSSPEYLDAYGDLPADAQRYCMIDASTGWLVPQVFASNHASEAQTVFKCRASRAVQNACAAGFGMSFLPCYVGDADTRLLRVSDPFQHLDMSFWVLTHPDLRNTARVRAIMAHFYEQIGALAPLFEGRSVETSATNYYPRDGW